MTDDEVVRLDDLMSASLMVDLMRTVMQTVTECFDNAILTIKDQLNEDREHALENASEKYAQLFSPTVSSCCCD